jgi:hypothetical protein
LLPRTSKPGVAACAAGGHETQKVARSLRHGPQRHKPEPPQPAVILRARVGGVDPGMLRRPPASLRNHVVALAVGRIANSVDEASDVGQGLVALTEPVAFYGFQLVPDVRVVLPDKGWPGWFEDTARPLLDRGIRNHHLHNPFGLHRVPGRDDRAMHIDQFELSYCENLRWLADRAAFAQAVRDVHQRGGTVRAYVGSPLVVAQSPQATYLPRCSPGSKGLSMQLRTLSRLGLCGTLRRHRCLCWDRLIRFHIRPLVDAGVDAIGFDSSPDFHPGDCMDRLVQSLLARRFEVMIEPWPRRDRDYPPVSWIIRELLYQRITLELRDEWAPLESVRGKIYRIVPADGPTGRPSELEEINTIRVRNGKPAFESVQEIVEAVRRDGHIPAVRAAQLSSAAIT